MVGIHPWAVKEISTDSRGLTKDWDAELRQLEVFLLEHPLWGLGEIGMDKSNRAIASIRVQEMYIEAQLDIAQSLDRPVIIHQVRSAGKIAAILEARCLKVPVMIHGWFGSIESAHRLVASGAHLSLGHRMFSSPAALKELVTTIPLNRLLIETDADLSILHTDPVGYTGHTDYAGTLMSHYEIFSNMLQIDIIELAGKMITHGSIFTNYPTHRQR